MTLTDFLLARIAEDESVAASVRDSHDPLILNIDDYPEFEAWGMFSGDGPSGYTSVIIDAARVLAECEAKRRIVERESNSQTNITYRRMMVLQDLATIYADHPDYRDEWKP